MAQISPQSSNKYDIKKLSQKELMGVALLFIGIVCIVGSFFLIKPLYLELQTVKESIVASVEEIELKTLKLEKLQIEMQKAQQKKDEIDQEDGVLDYDIAQSYSSAQLIHALNSIMGKEYGINMTRFEFLDPVAVPTMVGIKIQPIVAEGIMLESQILPTLERFESNKQLFSVKSVEGTLDENEEIQLKFLVDTYYVGEVVRNEKQ